MPHLDVPKLEDKTTTLQHKYLTFNLYDFIGSTKDFGGGFWNPIGMNLLKTYIGVGFYHTTFQIVVKLVDAQLNEQVSNTFVLPPSAKLAFQCSIMLLWSIVLILEPKKLKIARLMLWYS